MKVVFKLVLRWSTLLHLFKELFLIIYKIWILGLFWMKFVSWKLMVMLDQNVIKHIKKSNEFYLKIFTWMMNYYNKNLLQIRWPRYRKHWLGKWLSCLLCQNHIFKIKQCTGSTILYSQRSILRLVNNRILFSPSISEVNNQTILQILYHGI